MFVIFFFILFSSLVCLDEAGFAFVQWCINFIESKGLTDQGLYRLVGVNSKVAKLTQLALGNEDFYELFNFTFFVFFKLYRIKHDQALMYFILHVYNELCFLTLECDRYNNV